MIILDAYEIIDSISSKYKNWHRKAILRFENDLFNQQFSIISLKDFIDLIDSIRNHGLEELGAQTDRGIYKLIRVCDRIKEYTKKKSKMPFRNIYSIFFYKAKPPSGILIVDAPGFIFISGISDPRDNYMLRYSDQPAEMKKRISKITQKYELTWWGSVYQPVLLKRCSINASNFNNFIENVEKFFEKYGYAKI